MYILCACTCAMKEDLKHSKLLGLKVLYAWNLLSTNHFGFLTDLHYDSWKDSLWIYFSYCVLDFVKTMMWKGWLSEFINQYNVSVSMDWSLFSSEYNIMFIHDMWLVEKAHFFVEIIRHTFVFTVKYFFIYILCKWNVKTFCLYNIIQGNILIQLWLY